MKKLKALLCKNVLNDVTAAPFLVSFSQLSPVKKTPKTFVHSSAFRNLRIFSGGWGELEHCAVVRA